MPKHKAHSILRKAEHEIIAIRDKNNSMRWDPSKSEEENLAMLAQKELILANAVLQLEITMQELEDVLERP